MNRFKTKKRSKDDSAVVRPSLESESSFSLFRRGKKTPEHEEKKEIDIATALPSNDDFRTSLLMSGLSARFSMLREQNDPNTKIGKASDDSVLFPKRQSRLADFGFSSGAALGDIAEVESIRAPTFLRTDSAASNDSESVMTRSRPTEGNVLFGGRQKIYRINTGSASSKNLSDGMGGRALYDHDVALSAFQKYKQGAKQKQEPSLDDNEEDDNVRAASDEIRPTEDNLFITRSESPLPNGYNKKRETSSTTSSTPSVGRNSTAATSIVSQPTVLSKDGHSQHTTAASSATSTPVLERNVTRTRRLYEQGLNQDLQEQQHSVLSRVDTLTRRPGGARTPDLGPNSPSPTMQGFADRFAGERRTILTKGSAPNLRSISPPTTGSSIGTMDLSTRASNATESKGTFLSSPPLSPPISDAGTGEHSALLIQPKDHGKATAMGVFRKPSQPYDDFKYTERQLQRQQGRETPTQRLRNDSSPSLSLPLSTSVASTHQEDDIKTTILSTNAEPQVREGSEGGTFLETAESPILNEHVNKPSLSPQVRLERPSDQDHPAFRQSAVPTPLTFPHKVDAQQSPRSGNPNLLTVNPRQPMLGDSPTLGPNNGLGGMVRQHLRTESDLSSISSVGNRDSVVLPTSALGGQEWSPSRSRDDEHSSQAKPDSLYIQQAEDPRPIDQKIPNTFLESPHSQDEADEFANQLANARRRVREKLTSFVETDSNPIQPEAVGDLPPLPSRSNPLGILRGKSSRGSLIDRSREQPPKTTKMLGIGATTMATSPGSAKQNFDVQADRSPVATREHAAEDDEKAGLEEENTHPGFRAFTQARRDLQKHKELETTTRYPPQNGHFMASPVLERQMSMANDGTRELARTPSRERLLAGSRQPRKMGEDSQSGVPQPPPRSLSRAARDRSGSDENNDGQSRPRSRPSPRSRQNSTPYEDQQKHSEMLNAPATRKPTLRSPGLPGSDIRRSPIMPPGGPPQNGRHPVPGGQHLDRTSSAGNLRGHLGRTATEPISSGHSPLSPRSGGFGPTRAAFQTDGANGSAPPTPTYPPPRRPSNPTHNTLDSSMRRVITKNDISEPTFVSSTSRVPTRSLPQSATDARETRSRSESRSRSGSTADYGSPPPLPPVNPRRKRDSSRTRTIIGGLMGRKSDEADNVALSLSTPHLPLAGPPGPSFTESPGNDGKSAFSISDDEDGKPLRRKLRKASSDAKMDAHVSLAGPKRVAPLQVAIGPPAGRTVSITPNMRGPPRNVPGGMF